MGIKNNTFFIFLQNLCGLPYNSIREKKEEPAMKMNIIETVRGKRSCRRCRFRNISGVPQTERETEKTERAEK